MSLWMARSSGSLAGGPCGAAARRPPSLSRSIFRPEALEHHTGDGLHAEPLHMGTRWGRRAPLALLCLAALATAIGMIVRVDERASGPSLSGPDGGSIAAVLPAAAGPRLVDGGRLDVDLPGGRRISLSVAPGDLQPISTETAARRFGRDAAGGLVATATALVLVERRLATSLPAAERGPGRAGVVLDRVALLPMVLSGLFDRGPGG